jgi:hypothetical protein
VGTITTDLEVRLVDASGGYPEQILSLSQGFQHF